MVPAHIWPTLRLGVVQGVDRQRQIGEGPCGLEGGVENPSCVDEGCRDVKSLESRRKNKGKKL